MIDHATAYQAAKKSARQRIAGHKFHHGDPAEHPQIALAAAREHRLTGRQMTRLFRALHFR